MTYARTPSLRNRYPLVYRHFGRRVIGVPLHTHCCSVCLIANEYRNAGDCLAALMGILKSQLAGAVFFVRCKGKNIRVGGIGGCGQVVSIG